MSEIESPMKSILYLILFFGSLIVQGQVAEDFEDEIEGNTPDQLIPAWSGDSNQFLVVDESGNLLLRSNAGDLSSPLTYQISTPSNAIYDASWDFYVNLKFGTSGSNFVDVFLVSDSEDLTAAQNGYFVRIGDTEDWIALHKISDGSSTSQDSPLISSSQKIVSSSSNNPFRILVTRDVVGRWELKIDVDTLGVFTSIGTIIDEEILSSSFFGILVQQSSATAPANSHFFDDLVVTGTVIPDSTPPTIQLVDVISSTRVNVSFSEAVDEFLAEMTANYSIDQGVAISDAKRDEVNNALVELTVDSLTNGREFTLSVNNIQDVSGNVIAANSQIDFTYLVLEEAEEFDVVINEFIADPNPPIGLPDGEFVELLNRSEKFIDLANWTLDGQVISPFVMGPGEFVIIVEDNDLGLFDAYDNVLPINSLTLNNAGEDWIVLENDNSQSIHSILFSGSTSGISTELINPDGPDYSSSNYGLSTNAAGGTPGAQNSIFDDTPDTTPPTMISATVVSNTVLDIEFSERVEKVSAETIDNYRIDGDVVVESAELDIDAGTLVRLMLTPLTSGIVQTLTVSDVVDLSGNAAADATATFEYIETTDAEQGDVVINEFLALPSSESGIPKVEYVELYNNSSKNIDLLNWKLADAVSSSASFSSTVLRPDSYLILTESGNGDLFESYGDVLEVGSFPSLNNSGDSLTIISEQGIVIFELAYLDSEAGISTELINPNGPDYSSSNYGLSTNAAGGTPGAQNSIFDDTPDTTPPMIISATVVADTVLDIEFSERVEKVSAETIDNYRIDGDVVVESAELDIDAGTLVRLMLTPLTSGIVQTLTVSDVEDLSGNTAADATVTFEYIETTDAEQGDVVINEFLALPSAASGIPNVEYVELYNNSLKNIDLLNWKLADAVSSSASFSSTVLRPDSYLILTESGNGDLFESYGDVLEVGSFPSLNNSGDSLTIISEQGIVIFELAYMDSEAGISTELINPDGPDYSASNYGLSTNAAGGTPGAQNSIFDDTPDTTPPMIISATVVADTVLDIEFSERVEKVSAETIDNYRIDGEISILSATLDVDAGTLVRLMLTPLTSGIVQTLTVSDVEDLSGNTAADATVTFEYIETTDAEQGDVVINEFLALPSAASGIPNVEYVELYNNSLKNIDLLNWELADAVSSSASFSSTVLRPDSYLILTESGNGDLFESYGDVLEVSSFPSLNNSGDSLTIVNEQGIVIFELAYKDSEAGISKELINPDGPDYSSSNYGLSTNAAGGTPGAQNSIFDDTPDTTPPMIILATVVADTVLDIEFSERVEKVSAETIDNYRIDGEISILSATLDVDAGTLVRLILTPLTSGIIQTLTVSDLEDLSGNTAADATVTFEYIETTDAEQGDVVINEFLALPSAASGIPNVEYVELYNNSSKNIDLLNWKLADAVSFSASFSSMILRPDSYLILTESGNGDLFESYGDVLEVSSFPSLNNSGDSLTIVNEQGIVIFELAYKDSEAGISKELINPDDPCLSPLSYEHAKHPDGGTPGSQNSIFDDQPDLTPPKIDSFDFGTFLTINFSEVMDPASLSKMESYSIQNLTIGQVRVDAELPTSIEIQFSEKLVPGTVYDFTIASVLDCAGNALATTTISFSIGRFAEFNEVVITEIMFDADPTVGLPEREYIEIYNATDETITTEGIYLGDATSVIQLPAVNLKPKNYYVLTTSAAAPEFPSNSVGVSGFPSLNNSGEQLTLFRQSDLIFSVDYRPSWHVKEKRNGGVALEMVDVSNPCLEENNWRSSIARKGGTPGEENSIKERIPDSFGPEIVAVTAISSDSIEVTLNEKIDPQSIPIALVSIEPAAQPSKICFNPFEPKSLVVVVSDILEQNMKYMLRLTNISDCNGNLVDEDPFSFVRPSESEEGDLKLSEVLFNPRVNGVDFIEVHNDSDRFLSLTNWQLARITQNGISDEKVISEEQLVIEPQGYIVLTTDRDLLLTNYPKGVAERFLEMTSLPTYPNDTGSVVLLNDKHVIADRFFYDDDYHYDLLENTDGVSLERISFSLDTNDPNNWRSASSTEGFATPGYLNSQSITSSKQAGTIIIDPKVFIPGNTGQGRDFTTINYAFETGGKFANVNIYDQAGRLVKALANGSSLSNSGFFRWDGVTNNGSMARLGYYVVVFEIYDVRGNSETLKQTVVVGRDF